jgi:hypothetical protein
MLNRLYLTPLHGVRCGVVTPSATHSTANNSLPFSISVSENPVLIPSNLEPLWSLIDTGERYTSELHLYDIPVQHEHNKQSQNTAISGSKILEVKCEGTGRFMLNDNQLTIDWEAGGTDSSHYFQTSALALWLELNKVPCIHANALEFDGKCIALIGPSGMGKSTVSAYLQKQGFNWITDDMLALHGLHGSHEHTKCTVYPSWPQARMWPDSVNKTLANQAGEQSLANMPKVHERFNKLQVTLPENLNHTGVELSAIYLLNREGAQLSALQKNKAFSLVDKKQTQQQGTNHIYAINSRLALLSLLQNSMLGNAYSSLGLEASRLKQLSKLLNNTPVKQINYASNYESLSDVHNMIIADLSSK